MELFCGKVDPRADHSLVAEDDKEGAAFRDAVLSLLSEQLAACDGSASAHRWPEVAGSHVHIVVEGSACAPAELQWTFAQGNEATPALHGGARTADETEGPCAFVAGYASVWRSVLAGELNMAMQIMAGRIRCRSVLGPGHFLTPEVGALSDVLGLTAGKALDVSCSEATVVTAG